MAEKTFCAGCMRENKTNNVETQSWCNDCREPVCRSCAKVHKKLSPPHKVVQMSEVRGVTSDLLKMSIYCDKHPREKLSQFCRQHDSIICDSCSTDSHKKCDSILALKKAAEGVKRGTAINDLERRIKDIIKILEKNLNTKTSENNGESKAAIVEKIRDVKNKMIEHLDKLEDNLLQKVEEIYSKIHNNVDQKPFSSELPVLRRWESDLKTLRNNSSDVYLFQVVKILDKKVHLTEQEISTKQLPVIPIIQFTPSEFAEDFENTVQSIGTIQTRKPDVISPKLELEQQGQASVESTKFTLMSSFATSKIGEGVKIWRGCFISSSRLLLSQSGKKFLYICNTDGSKSKSIKLDFVPELVALYDNSTALVSSGKDFLQTMNLSDLKLGKKIKVGKECYGIGCRDSKIWINSEDKTLTMIDISGKVMKKITTTFDPWDICVHRSGDVYCTGMGSDSVYAVTPEGKEREVYKGPDLSGTRGIAIDSRGYIYVSGRDTNNIHRISPNGKDHTVVLTEEVGIKEPFGIAFNKDTNDLMVINDGRTAIHLYKS